MRALLYRVYLRVHMAIGNENIRPAIVIKIDKASSPGYIRKAGLSDLRRAACVFKAGRTKVAVEGLVLIGEGGVDNIEQSIMVVIAEIYSHVALLLTFAAQRHSGK